MLGVTSALRILSKYIFTYMYSIKVSTISEKWEWLANKFSAGKRGTTSASPLYTLQLLSTPLLCRYRTQNRVG